MIFLFLIWICGTLSMDLSEYPGDRNGNENVVYDLCIVGAGMFGSAAARHASANRHLKICLIGLDEPSSRREYEERDIFASYYDAGRIVLQLLSSPAHSKLVNSSIRQFPHLERLSGIHFYKPVGFLQIGRKGDSVMRMSEDSTSAINIPFRRIYNQHSMNRKFPFIKMEDSLYALHDYTGGGVLNPRKMVQAEQKVAEQQGCDIIVDRVENVKPLKNNVHIIKTTNNGNIKAKKVLFTTGAFTNLNKFDDAPRLNMDVIEELVALIRIPEDEAHRLRYMPAFTYESDDTEIYVLPPLLYPDGEKYIKIGLQNGVDRIVKTKEEIKQIYLFPNQTDAVLSIANPLFDIIPGLKSDGIFGSGCVYSLSSTRYPYIDKWTPTITVAAVGNGNGAMMSEEIGRLAAHLSLYGEWDSDIPHSLYKIVTRKD